MENVNEVDVSPAEIARDFDEGLNRFGIELDVNYSTGGESIQPVASEPETKEPEISAADGRVMIEKGITSIFTLITNRVCPNYQVTKEEHDMLGEYWADAALHYFPGLNAGPLLTAVAMTGIVFGDRMAHGIPARLPPPGQTSDVKSEAPITGANGEDLNATAGAVHEE